MEKELIKKRVKLIKGGRGKWQGPRRVTLETKEEVTIATGAERMNICDDYVIGPVY